MAEPYESEEHETELRGRLMKRLAVAGVMVALLLGVLAFFDSLSTPPEPLPKVFTKPVPVAPKKEMTQPVTPNIELAEPPKTESPAADEKVPAVPAPAELPPKPEVAAEPAPPVPADNKSSGKIQPQRSPSAVREATPAAPARSVPESSAAPATPASPTAPPVPSAQQQIPAAPPVAVPQPILAAPPPLARLLPGYVVQAGVFSNARAAEELHAKLALNGIPSSLEARVQVGPFKTRAEAEAAREKIKALGIGAILIPPTNTRR